MRRNRLLGALAVAFGVLTLISGGSVLFGAPDIRAAAGNVVLPVLWFNFLSGAVYVLAGIGIMLARPWGRTLARVLALAIAAMLVLLVALILSGTSWEMRTLVAMCVRLGFWLAVLWGLHRGT